jgi:hypothetical protein
LLAAGALAAGTLTPSAKATAKAGSTVLTRGQYPAQRTRRRAPLRHPPGALRLCPRDRKIAGRSQVRAQRGRQAPARRSRDTVAMSVS